MIQNFFRTFSRVVLLVVLIAVTLMVVVNGFATSSAPYKNTASAETLPDLVTPVCPTSFTVNDNGDAADATPGDESCSTAGAVCTLRAAIEEANALPACAVIDIDFSGVTSPISLNTALPAIDHSVNLNGPGASLLTVRRSTAGGTPNFRIFTIQAGYTVLISGLTLTNGNVTTASFPLNNGGAIFNSGSLTLTGITASGNAGASGGGGGAGGIYNTGTLSLISSTVSGNSGGLGGGITNENGDTLNVTNSRVTANAAVLGGGGIFNNFGTVNLTSSTISGNGTTLGAGGGLSSSGPLTSINSTISGNSTSDGDGAGILNTGSVMNLINTTVSGNVAQGSGGGILNNPTSTLNITNSTIASNVANGSPGPVGPRGGGIYNAGTTSLKNTIVANNTVGANGAAPDLFNSFNSQDYNLIGNTSGATFTGTTTHNITNVNAKLSVLANNGGPTFTHALISGSPAIDAGDNAAITNPPFIGPPFTDQRGGAFNRIADGDGNASVIVDIGAYELQAPLTIDNVNTKAGRTSGGQQIQLTGAFANLSTVTMGGTSATWFYTNGADTSAITVT